MNQTNQQNQLNQTQQSTQTHQIQTNQLNQLNQTTQTHLIIYKAIEGERLDSIYFQYFKVFHQASYDSFMQDNYLLLFKDTLDGGDTVVINMVETVFKDDVTKGLYGIEVWGKTGIKIA